jgi:meso-butanediol dehydrogenase/(S,S)-butanediol dehydrogenase/diacetyl reductase
MAEIRDSVTVVTGAGRGVGRAIALALAERGGRVVLCARSADDLARVADEVSERGGVAETVPGDIREEAVARALAEKALNAFGRIDTLVNNAGIGGYGPVEALSLESWQRVLDTNLTGAFLCSRAVLPAMRRQGSGHIIMIASGAGKQGYSNMAAYSASKFGLIGFAQALAQEVGDDGIKVCTITPGSIVSSFGGSGTRPGAKYLLPEDVAEAVLYLIQQSERAWTQEMSLWPFKVFTPEEG